MAATLPAITALARAGAVARAWEEFEAGGYAERTGSAAAQAVKGRLLKDRARLAPFGERRTLFSEAAAAYGAAGAIEPSPYYAINAATLHLLAGEVEQAIQGAAAVLKMLDSATAPVDTPYYLAATRAEALLLREDEAGAIAEMRIAARADPDGWHDRAGTIGQLREIAEAQGRTAPWLEEFAPPASLHFAGHIGVAAGGRSEAVLLAEVDSLLDRERIGFAWGALAAGADIVIAERLLAAGCELHAVLPCPPELFEAQSVAPAGEQWVRRYRALLDACVSVRAAGDCPAAVHDPLATAHAGELAIGAALLNARTLSARALQLIVVDEHGGGMNTAAQEQMWRPELGPQIRVVVPRDQSVDALFPPEQHDPTRVLAVHGVISIETMAGGQRLVPAALAAASKPIAAALSALPTQEVRAAPGRWEFTSTDLEQALAVTLDVQARCRAAGSPLPSAALHLEIGNLVLDAASNTLVPYGPGPAMASRLHARAPAGAILVSDTLAVTLAARGLPGIRTELFHFGEEETGGAVHLLRERTADQ